MRSARIVAASALVALPAAVTVYLAFNAGGFFPFAPGVVATGLAVTLGLRIVLTEEPLPGLSPPLLVVIAATLLLAVWTLLSADWSHAPGRALIEFDRTLLYLLVLLACAAFAGTPARLRWLVRSMAAGAFLVSGAAFVSRALPHVWPVRQTLHPERLSFPLTYWNSLGLLAAIGLLLCVYMTTSEREPRAVRVLSAAASPVLASALLFTYSRGGLAVAVVGLVVYALLARPRALAAGLAAVAPTVAVALVVTYDADKVSSSHPTSAAAVAQGRGAAIAVALAALAAGVLRQLLLGVDDRLSHRRPMSRRSFAIAGGTSLAVIVALALSLDVPSSIGKQYDRFLKGGDPQRTGQPVRNRLSDASNTERLTLWRVALHGFRSQPFHGVGAGGWQPLWNQRRPFRDNVNEGHSAYLETLAELGIVGLILLVVAVVGALIGLAARIRGPDRALYAGLFAAALAWALAAGVDWHWEMPAVTVLFFAAAGGGLAGGFRGRRLRISSTPLRVAVAIAAFVVAITPARVAVSDAHLTSGVNALKRGDCTAAIDAALASTGALDSRPEPFEVLGFCDVRLRQPALAVRVTRNAVKLDPQSWETHYALAVVEAAAGLDPLAEVRTAYRLNPRGELPIDAVNRFLPANRGHWRRLALSAPVPLD